MEIENFLTKLAQDNLILIEQNDTIVLQGSSRKLTSEEIGKIKSDIGIVNYIRDNKAQLITYLKNNAVSEKYKPREVESIYPLSHLQEGMLFHGLYNQSSNAYMEQYSWDISNLDIAIFKTTWAHLIKQHTILRSAFYYEELSVPVQCAYKDLPLPLDILDYTIYPEEEIKKRVSTFIKEDYDRRISFDKAPLIRISLLKMAANTYKMVWTHHHILLDGWSVSLLMGEMLDVYGKLCKGETPQLEEDKYEDFVRYIEKKDKFQQEDYWKKYLSPLDGPCILPFVEQNSLERNKGAHPGAMKKNELHLDEKQTNLLQQYAQQNRITVNTVIQGIWAFLLSKYTGKSAVVYGVTVSGRPAALDRVEQRVGLYINAIPLCTIIESGKNVREWLRALQEEHTRSREYEHTSLAQIQGWIGMRKDLFDSLLVYENYPVSEALKQADMSGLEITNLIRAEEETNYLLTLTARLSDRLRIDFSYNSELLTETYVRMIIDHFTELLHTIPSNDELKLSELKMLSQKEVDQLLVSFNNTKTEYPKDKTVIDLFEEQVVNSPDNVAFVFKERKITYLELDVQSNKLANFLKKQGVSENYLVPVYMNRGIDMVIGILAILKAGAVYVPIDADYPKERVNFILKDISATSVMLAGSDAQLDELGYNVINLNDDRIKKETKKSVKRKIAGEDSLLCLIYTSGSTGVPKGVKIKNTSVVNRFYWMWELYPFSVNECNSIKTSISFVDHIWELFGALLKGVPGVILSKEDLLDIPSFVKQFSAYGITRIVLVPSLLNTILNTLEALDVNALNSLKYCICSGEALTKELVDNFYLQLPDCKLINIYGSSEVTADVTFFDTSVNESANRLLQKADSLFSMSIKDEVEGLISEFNSNTDIIKVNSKHSFNDYYDVSTDKNWDPKRYIEFLRNDLLPGIVNVSRPGFIGHMTSKIPEFIKEISLLLVELNQNVVKIETSFTGSLIERQVIGMMHKRIFKLKHSFYQRYVQDSESCLGVVTNGGTISNITALSYALNKSFPANENFKGVLQEGIVKALRHYNYEGVAVIASPLAHYSINKAMRILGLGTDNWIKFALDRNNIRESKEELVTIIEKLKQKKIFILSIIGIAGTTETGAIDLLEDLGEIAQQYKIHYHVDAAFGGVYLFSEKLSKKLNAIKQADTVTICGHKQMYLPQGASVCIFRSPDFASFSESNTHYQSRKGSYDLGRYSIEGSRSFMSLLFHSALKILGTKGFSEIIEHNYNQTRLLAELIRSLEEFQLIEEPVLNILIYRYVPKALRMKIGKQVLTTQELKRINTINKRLQKMQFLKGNYFVSYTELELENAEAGVDKSNVVVLRVVVMNPNTTRDDFKAVLREQIEIGKELDKDSVSNSNTAAIADVNYILQKRIERNVPIGKPLANTTIYILDPSNEHVQLQPIGVIGEIGVSGDCLSAGYWNLPALTDEKFVPNPFKEESGTKIYRTGDLARWLPDGNIEYLGRKDDQVKIRGYRIELGEIETVLAQHETVKQCVVIAREDTSGGSKQLVAYVVPESALSKEEIMNYLYKKLPDYMIPNMLVELDALPLNANGKINKKALPGVTGDDLARMAYIAPRSEEEHILIKVLQDVLNVEKIGIYDNFYHLGGNSLKSIQVSTKLKKAGYLLSVIKILKYPVIYELAQHLENKNSGFENNTEDLLYSQPVLLSMNQRVYINEEKYNHAIGHFRLSIVSFDKEKFNKVVSKVIELVPELRVRILKDGERLFQELIPQHQFVPDIRYDVKDLNDANAIEESFFKARNEPFDLFTGNLFRINVFYNSTDAVVQITIHHIITDFESNKMLIRLINQLYNGHQLSTIKVGGNGVFSRIQQQALTSTDFKKLLNDRVAQLSKIVSSGMKNDIFYNVNELDSEIETHTIHMDKKELERIKEVCHLNGILLSNFLLSFCIKNYVTVDTPFLINSTVNSRDFDLMGFDLENRIGQFTNTIPVEINLEAQVNIDLLIHNAYLTSKQYQEIPYELLDEAFSIKNNCKLSQFTLASFNNADFSGTVNSTIKEGRHETTVDHRTSIKHHPMEFKSSVYDNGVILEIDIDKKYRRNASTVKEETLFQIQKQ